MPRFTLPITPTAADIDELGHVSNLVYVRWVLEIATAHSASVGWGHPEYRALGAIFVVRRHEIDYVAQVREGDALIGETWVDDWKLASCVRKTELRRADLVAGVAGGRAERGVDGQVVARAATTWAMLSLASGRPTKIPDHLRTLFA